MKSLLDKVNPLPLAVMALGLITTAVLVITKHVDAAVYSGLLNVVLQAIVPQIYKKESKDAGEDSGS